MNQSFFDRFGIFLIATWFGLAAGLIEGVTSILLKGLPGFAVRVPPDILWIAPIFYLLLFLSIGAGFCLFFRLIGKTTGVKVTTVLFTWITLFNLIMVLDKIHIVAALILTLGLAVQIGRWLRNHEQHFLSFVSRTLLVVGAITLVLGVLGAQWNRWHGHKLAVQLPEPKPEVANVLLIVLDTLRADHLSCYGYQKSTTPHIDRLARQGALFDCAFSNSSWTLPAHASLFTGRLPHEHKADWLNPFDGSYPTLAQVLADRGYLTAAFSANTSYVSPEWGLSLGFVHFEVYGSSLAGQIISTQLGRRLALNILPRLSYFDIPGRKRAERVNHEFLSWLDGIKGRPFFVFLNYMEVHDPYLTTPSYQTKFSDKPTRGDLINFQFQAKAFRRKPFLSPEEIQMEKDGYDGCLAYLDAMLGELLSELAKRDLEKNTLVIITSDHGESFGDHDLFGHGNSLYLETLRVPLIFYWPERIPSGVRISRVVGLHQVPRTVMELVIGAPAPFSEGGSLMKLWLGDIDTRGSEEVVLSEVNKVEGGPPKYPTTSGGLKSLVTDRWHFILSETGRAELYAWREDPRETENLAETHLGRNLVEEFKSRLAALSGNPASKGNRQ